MKIRYIYTFLISLLICNTSPAQEPGNEYHTRGLVDLKDGKIAAAESTFYHSAKEFSFAPSWFELAKIESDKNTVYSRDKARDFIQKAIWIDPSNIEYRLLKAKLMEVYSSNMASDVYEGVLDIDSNNTEALFNLGRISAAQFNEYHNSFMNYDEGSVSYNDYAYKFYLKAVNFFRRAIRTDPERSDSYIQLSYLYSETGLFEYGIPLLKKVIQIDSLNKEAYLFLGYLYYKTLGFENCQTSYKKALDLMTESERKDFLDSTTIMLAGDKEVEPDKVDKIVSDFWNSRDPLYLSKYNERLLEHFSRVAYSNIMFSVTKQHLKGWKSDRGEILVRYGEPDSRVRLRPYIEAGGKTQIMLKTDLWVYKNKTFGFTDDSWNNNFRFSVPNSNGRYFSQFQFDTYSYAKNLERIDPEEYVPKFKGPVFTLPYEVVQFKDLTNDENPNTQIFLNYALKDSGYVEFNNFHPQHKSGLFIFDGRNNKIGEQVEEFADLKHERNLKINTSEKYLINSMEIESKPDSVSLAFEVIRKKDNGVSSNHFRFLIKDFDVRKLDVSDILLAADVEKQPGKYPLTRKELGILPNPTRTFNHNTDIYLYYEVYNLSQDEDQKTNFQQKITLKKVKETSFIDDIFSSIAGLFSSKHNDEIILTTNYQTFEKNAQIYLQLDMNNYQPGDYIVTVTIDDKFAGSESSSQTLLKWR